MPTLAGGYLPCLGGGVLTLARGYLPWSGVSTLAGGYLPWLGGGGTYLGQGVPTLAGVPSGCEQTDACENSTVPHSSDAGGNKRKVTVLGLYGI